MPQEVRISSEDEKLRRFAATYRGDKKRERISIVARGRQFAAVFKTPLGQEILKDAQGTWAFNLTKIINGEATEEDRVRFTVLDDLLTAWSSRLYVYYEESGKIDDYLRQLDEV